MSPKSLRCIKVLLVVVLIVAVCVASYALLSRNKIYVDVAEDCSTVPADGFWKVFVKEFEKVCPPGTSCRETFCACDDLSDKTIMGHSHDENYVKVCRRIAGQHCSRDSECFKDVDCVKGVCTCDETKLFGECVNYKNSFKWEIAEAHNVQCYALTVYVVIATINFLLT